jgi:hypothetical protein
MTKQTITKEPGTLPGNITQEQFDAWKKEHGDIHTISVYDDSQTKTCYLKPPGRNVVAVMMTRHANKQILEAGEFAIQNCWLGGDDSLRNPSSSQKEQMFSIKAATLAFNVLELPGGQYVKN